MEVNCKVTCLARVYLYKKLLCYFSSCLFLFAQCFHFSFLFLIWLHWLGHSVPHSLSKSLILDKCHWQVWRCSLVVEASLACTRLWFPGTMGVGSTASLQMFKNIYIYSLKKALSFSPSFFALQTFQFWEKTRLCCSGSPLTSALKWSSRALSLSLSPHCWSPPVPHTAAAILPCFEPTAVGLLKHTLNCV